MTSNAHTIYFDVTDLLEVGPAASGIQRVALRVIAQMVARHTETALCVFDQKRNQITQVERSWCTEYFDNPKLDFLRVFDLPLQSPLQYLARYKKRPLRYFGKLIQMALKLVTRDKDYFAKLHIQRPFGGPRSYKSLLRPAGLRAGDIVVLLGATWSVPRLAALFAEYKRHQVNVVPFVHDLIAIVRPQFVPDRAQQQTREWLSYVATTANTFAVGSKSTAADLSTYLAASVPDRIYNIVHVPLAHEFIVQRGWRQEDIRAEVRAAARLPYILVVGTMEIRKNNWGLATVWNRIVEKLGLNAPRLIFAGNRGWLNQDFGDFLRGTGNANGYIRIVNRPSDAELKYLYENCQFTVYLSYYEGWGLPIGESLWFGKVCLTASTSSMPEVGGNKCVYADPYDLNDLYDKLMDLIVNVERRRELEQRIDRSALRRWQDVADDLYSRISPSFNSAR